MPTPPLAHERQHRLDHRDCSKNIDVELTPHLFERALLKRPFMAVSCTVDEDVYRTNIPFDPCNRGTDGCEIRYVQHDGARACGVHRTELLSSCFASHRADHGKSRRERLRRQSPSEAGTCTRDQKIPLSTHRHVPPPES